MKHLLPMSPDFLSRRARERGSILLDYFFVSYLFIVFVWFFNEYFFTIIDIEALLRGLTTQPTTVEGVPLLECRMRSVEFATASEMPVVSLPKFRLKARTP